MRKIFTFILALVASAGTLFADKVKIGDLYYNLNAEDKTAEVTYETTGNSNYLGLYVLNIPDTVKYDNSMYGVTSIGYSAFQGSSLKRVILPSTLKRIGAQAFAFCGSLKTIHIPENVQTIDPVAFMCVEPPDEETLNFNSNFQSITVDENNKYFASKDGVLFNKSLNTLVAYPVGKTGNYTISNTVESIERFAFAYSCYLTKMIIPDNVLHIGLQAFCVMPRLDSVIVGNGVDRIPEGCFYLCQNLRYISFGEKVKEISLDALYFAKDDNDITLAPLSTIVIYASQVPQIVKAEYSYIVGPYDYSDPETYIPITTEDLPHVFENISRKAHLYVPGDAVLDYEMHSVWGGFDVRPITAQSTETTEVQISATESSANIIWPSVSGAATYELVIKDKSGNVVCTLIFNAQGQLTQIAFHVPSRNGAPQHTQTAGFSFTVTGLNAGTAYDLTMTSKDAIGQVIEEQTISFTTEANIPTGVEDVQSDQVQSTKVLRDGQIYILRGDHIFDTQGKMVK